jgi:hypothetical protein
MLINLDVANSYSLRTWYAVNNLTVYSVGKSIANLCSPIWLFTAMNEYTVHELEQIKTSYIYSSSVELKDC